MWTGSAVAAAGVVVEVALVVVVMQMSLSRFSILLTAILGVVITLRPNEWEAWDRVLFRHSHRSPPGGHAGYTQVAGERCVSRMMWVGMRNGGTGMEAGERGMKAEREGRMKELSWFRETRRE